MKKIAILFLTVAFLVVMALPVSALDWYLGGSARVHTYWTDKSEELPNYWTGSDYDGNVIDLENDLNGTAFIKGGVNHGNIGGHFLYFHNEGRGVAPNLGSLYGTLKLGDGGELLVGQHVTPWTAPKVGCSRNITVGGLSDDTGYAHSLPWNGRDPMVQYSRKNWKVAIVKVDEKDPGEVVLPKLEAHYRISPENMKLDFSAMYQTYDLDDTVAGKSGGGDSLDSYGLGFKFEFRHLDPVYFRLGGFYAINPDNAGQPMLNRGRADTTDAGEVENTTGWAVAAIVGTTFANGIMAEAGVSTSTSSNDNWAEDDEAMSYYAQLCFPLGELGGVGKAFITPEIGYVDFKKDRNGVDEGDITYAGIKWEIRF